MNCHFVYAVPPNNKSIVSSLRRKLLRQGFPVSLLTNRTLTETSFSEWPIQSPYEVTKNVYLALSKKVTTYLYHLTERTGARFEDGDIFLGHPFFPADERRVGLTEIAINSNINFRKKAIITPLHFNQNDDGNHINHLYLDKINLLFPKLDVIFGIMGEYWWDEIDKTKYKHWKEKLIRLDMAIDITKFPKVKKQFNNIGKRGYLYIGKNEPRKGISFFVKLYEGLKEYPFAWIGDGQEIDHIPRISTHRALTPEFMSEISKEYDFFLSPSYADANPTTILEAMCWGFPVLCTPQSGYYANSNIKNLNSENLEESIQTLRLLQFAPESDLQKISNDSRKYVENYYTWNRFESKITNALDI